MTDIEIVNADALELDADFFAAFDAQITDFPYSPHVHENAVSVSTVEARGANGLGVQKRDFEFEPLSPELRMQGAICAASVKRWSIVFADWQGAHLWDAEAATVGSERIRWVPWIRWSQPQLSGDRPTSGSEAVLIYHTLRGGKKPVSKHWNGPGSLTHFNRRCMRGQDKHPTEKPLDLMLDLVCYFSDPGETVIDLCGGSGSTAQACRLLGRNCVSIERDPRWAIKARDRVTGRLSARDFERAREWCALVHEEASSVPVPRAADGSDVKTYERAQRRLSDVARVAEAL